MQRAMLVVFSALLLSPVLLEAQKSELALTAGAAVSPDGKGFVTCGEAVPNCPIPPGTIGSLSIGPGFSWQANYALRVANFKVAGLYIELPVVGSPSRTTPGLFSEFSSIYFTPSAHVKLLPSAPISPFASVGGGLAHFRDSTGSSSGTTGALQVGGGLDFKTPLPRISFRVEVRDFITGRPGNQAFAAFTSSHIQTFFAGGGVVFRF